MLAQSEVRVVLNNIGIRLQELYTIYASDTVTETRHFSDFSFLSEPRFIFMYGYFYV